LISSAAIWRTALRARFLRLDQSAPPSRSRGLLATDIAGDLVEGVRWHEQPVGGRAALGRAVLQDEIFAHRALHLALAHLHEPAHAVLLVDDVVAGLEFERVDLRLRRAGIARMSRVVERFCPEMSSPVSSTSLARSSTQPVLQLALSHLYDAVGHLGQIDPSTSRAGDVVIRQHLDGALHRTVDQGAR
jgi:hypothetical protein